MKERGQSLVESALVLLVFLSMLLGVFDCAQVLFAHQALVERVRTAVRWGMIHPDQGTEPISNLVLYNQTAEPRAAREGYLGLKPENVHVIHRPATADAPDDELLTVSIVNYESHFFSPWIARVLVTPRPVMMSVPVSTVKTNGL
jgi:Flp pilus assembly protein TadG